MRLQFYLNCSSVPGGQVNEGFAARRAGFHHIGTKGTEKTSGVRNNPTEGFA